MPPFPALAPPAAGHPGRLRNRRADLARQPEGTLSEIGIESPSCLASPLPLEAMSLRYERKPTITLPPRHITTGYGRPRRAGSPPQSRAERRFRLATESRVVTPRCRSAAVQYVRFPGPAW